MSYLTTRCEYCRKLSTTSSNSSPGMTAGSDVVHGRRPATGSATSVTLPEEVTNSTGTVNSTVLLVVTRPNRTHVAPRVRSILTSDQLLLVTRSVTGSRAALESAAGVVATGR